MITQSCFDTCTEDETILGNLYFCRVRLERIEQLKHGHTKLSGQIPQSEVVDLKLEPSLISKPKKRKITKNTERDDSGDESDGEEDEDDDLNWRAKAV